jgi:hypothetical protein
MGNTWDIPAPHDLFATIIGSELLTERAIWKANFPANPNIKAI